MLAWLSKLVSKISLPYNRDINPEEYLVFKDADFTGCIVLTYTPWQLGNLFIPGKYKHAEIYCGDGDCVAARRDGVTSRRLFDVLSNCKSYCVLLPNDTDADDRADIAEYALSLADKGIEYDFNFDLRNQAYYCSELVAHCFDYVLGRQADYGKRILPDELRKDHGNWSMVYLYEERI